MTFVGGPSLGVTAATERRHHTLGICTPGSGVATTTTVSYNTWRRCSTVLRKFDRYYKKQEYMLEILLLLGFND